jgi:hypothetical protein
MKVQPLASSIRWFALLASVVSFGCSAQATGSPGDGPELVQNVDQRVGLIQSAYCSIKVLGVGTVDMETDYLPHVVACENGGAGLQALKAQAIAARSVAYYYMASQGAVCDGQGCQVYSCGAQPSALHYQAVAETAQQYLSYGAMLTYGFYVAGDPNASGPSCVDVGGVTTKYVTYNSGKTGTAVTQTTLGWVGPPGFGQNRGCMSQWGARCLESQQGADALGILHFYYGEDIGITTAPGDCGVAPVPSPAPASSCGDGACNGSEDCSWCEADCGACAPSPEPTQNPPSAGGECASSCGGQAPSGCWCDEACSHYGDCCSDGSSCSACGHCDSGAQPPPPNPNPGSSCSVASHMGNGENGESCSEPAETWRCVFIPSWGTWGSQVCRYGMWLTYNLNPQDCSACCGPYVDGCSG